MSNAYAKAVTEAESTNKAAHLLTEILRKVFADPEDVQVLQSVENGKTVFQVYASPTDIRTIKAGNGRMAESLESIARALSKPEGRAVRVRFSDQPQR